MLISLARYISFVTYALICIPGFMIGIPLGMLLPVKAISFDGSIDWILALFASIALLALILPIRLKSKPLFVTLHLLILVFLLGPLAWILINFDISWLTAYTVVPFSIFIVSFSLYCVLSWTAKPTETNQFI